MKRRYIARCLATLLALSLCACGGGEPLVESASPAQSTPVEESHPVEATPVESVPVESVPVQSLPVETVPAETAPAEESPEQSQEYTIALEGIVPIYAGPSYDEGYVRTVGQNGVYTIVEAQVDDEGNRWGRLKSGAGWVCLSYVDFLLAEQPPLSAAYADDALLSGGVYHEFILDNSEWMQRVVFYAREELRDVCLYTMELTQQGMELKEAVYTMDVLGAGESLVAGVVFYGDMTTYALSFTDAQGAPRTFTVSVSGRNGSLVLSEFG